MEFSLIYSHYRKHKIYGNLSHCFSCSYLIDLVQSVSGRSSRKYKKSNQRQTKKKLNVEELV